MTPYFHELSDEEQEQWHSRARAEWRLTPEQREEKLRLERMSWQDQSDYLNR